MVRAQVTYLDTHVAIALYERELAPYSPQALAAIENDDDLRISPMVLLELQYLLEIKRIKAPASRIAAALEREIGLQICDSPFPDVARQALAERWTRDPFDRIIVAQARLRTSVLITRDREIRARYSQALA